MSAGPTPLWRLFHPRIARSTFAPLSKMNAHNAGILQHLRRLYDEPTRAFAFRGQTPDDFRTWSCRARPALRALIGLNSIEEATKGFAPRVSSGPVESLEGYSRRQCILHAEPDFDVPFWCLTPASAGPHPIALFPHGHYAEHGLDFAVGIAATPDLAARIEDEDRDVAVQAVQLGFMAIAPATRGFHPVCIGDLNGRHGNSHCRSHLIHSLLAGRTPIGERVWDLQCLIDWAVAQPGVDATKVVMMGNSGGGVATLYAAACDERITVAVASCSFCTFVGEDGVVHHCDCNTVPGILRFGEFWDVAGLIAPRPLLLVHGATDPLFPAREIERAVAGVARIYEAAGAATRMAHVWGPAGHRFYRDLMWPFVLEQCGLRS